MLVNIVDPVEFAARRQHEDGATPVEIGAATRRGAVANPQASAANATNLAASRRNLAQRHAGSNRERDQFSRKAFAAIALTTAIIVAFMAVRMHHQHDGAHVELLVAFRQYDLGEPVGKRRTIRHIHKLDSHSGLGVSDDRATQLAKLNQSTDLRTLADLNVSTSQR